MAAAVNILLVEDNPGDARLIIELLKDTAYATASCRNASSMHAALKDHIFEPGDVALVLLDLDLPDSKGLDGLENILDHYCASAVVVLTGLEDDGLAIKALQKGAQNYLVKDSLRADELERTLRFSIERHAFIMRLRESDQELLDRERRFRTLVENSSDLTMLVDARGKITYASPSVHRLFGFIPHGSNAFEALYPSNRRVAIECMNETLLKPSIPLDLLIRTRTAEGVAYTLEGTMTNFLHRDGVNAIVVNLHDVSVQIAAMERVTFERNNQKALINSTRDMIWSVDRDLRIITANKAFKARHRLRFNEDIKPGDLSIPDKEEYGGLIGKWNAYYSRVLSGESFSVEEFVAEPGPFWSEITFNPIFADCEIIGVACAARDVTQRKGIEEEIRRLNADLEDRVIERTKELMQANEDLSVQMNQNNVLSELLMQQNVDLTASINYARRIQEGLFHSIEDLHFFSDVASLAIPRDIVSGDFLWHHETRDHVHFVLGDCTGHGVPGALMSVLAHSILNQLIIDRGNEKPENILFHMDKTLRRLFTGNAYEDRPADGMDVACMVVEKNSLNAVFSGALLNMTILRDGEFIDLKGSRTAIGGSRSVDGKNFFSIPFELLKGDRILLSSDGYYSQFGGPLNKKMKRKYFRDLIQATRHLPVSEAIEELRSKFTLWSGNEPQVDDVLVVLLDV